MARPFQPHCYSYYYNLYIFLSVSLSYYRLIFSLSPSPPIQAGDRQSDRGRQSSAVYTSIDNVWLAHKALEFRVGWGGERRRRQSTNQRSPPTLMDRLPFPGSYFLLFFVVVLLQVLIKRLRIEQERVAGCFKEETGRSVCETFE